MKRRRSRFHFRPLHFVITFVVLLGLSLYSALAFGTGPLSFLASRAEINEVTGKCSLASDEDECNDMASSCRWDGKYCKAKITGTIGSGPGGGGGNTSPVKAPPAPDLEKDRDGFCQTNGSPVKAGTWAVAKGSQCAKCLDCANNPKSCNGRKVGFEFDPDSTKWMECSEVSIKTGGSVTYPGYAATAAERFCGKGATSCKSCFAKVNGRYIQIGIGQEISPGLYCAPDGNPVALKDLQTSMSKLCPDQQWVPGRGCQPIPAKEPTAEEKKLADAKKACEARTAKGEKVGWDGKLCSGTAQTGQVVNSSTECASGKAIETTDNRFKETFLKCVDAAPGTVVPNASYCKSNLVTVNSKNELVCINCKAGPTSANSNTYITCDANGKSHYNYCSNGIFQTKDRFGEAKWECKQPAPNTATPAQPAANAQTPTYICIGEMLYKKTLNSYGTYTTTLTSGCGGLGCKDNKCNEPTPAQQSATNNVNNTGSGPTGHGPGPGGVTTPPTTTCPEIKKKCGDDGISIMTCSGAGVWKQTSNCEVPFDQKCIMENGIPKCGSKVPTAQNAPTQPTTTESTNNFGNAISKTVACQIHLLTWGPFGLPDYLRCRFGW